MILSVALYSGTNLANVRYEWLANGVIGAEQSTGITLPDAAYSNFRFDVTPPTGAEELIAYDVTNLNNWNVAQYLLSLPKTAIIPSSNQLSSLRYVVAAYLRVDPAVFIVNGVDLFLNAANGARMSAENNHDFEYSRVSATLDLTAAGADLRDATIVDGEATKGLKSIVSLGRAGQNGFIVPLDFTRLDIAQERDRSELELYDSYYGNRYPGDMGIYYYGTNTGIVQRGHKLKLWPGFTTLDPTTVTLYIEGYGLLRDYGTFDPGDQPEDFIVEFGIDYLQWSIICELNIMLAALVPRQEGNLPPPTAERDAAWKSLVLWDSYLVDSALTRSA